MSGNKINSSSNTLTDRFGREHNYLRFSITNQCNFSCSYCRPDKKACDVSDTLMNTNEIVEIAKAFSNLGIKKIRLTGGEPLVHNKLDTILYELGKLPIELAITTNGYLLDKYFVNLKSNGVKKLNISLDTLQEDRFKSITKRNAFYRVYSNLILAAQLGFDVKLNAVIMRGTNEDEIVDFAKLTQKYPITVRFIEFMPFRDNNWNFGKTYSRGDMLKTLESVFSLKAIEKKPGQTAEHFSIPNALGKIGIISTLSHPFCSDCNRIRILADGKIKNCLFGSTEYDLITPYREGKDLIKVIQSALDSKNEQHGGNKPFKTDSSGYFDNRNMFSIGG